jgi:IclR family acetate operon transcriptional repressor
MLVVFELIAQDQPIGVSAIARALEADKSAVQRDLMTLGDAGWIRQVPGTARHGAGAWELTAHMLTLAQPPASADVLRQRARPVLEELRAGSGETAYLTIPHGGRFLVLEAAESHNILRMVSPVGMVVPVEGSATARVILPLLDAGGQAALLGREPDAAMLAEFAETRERGYCVSAGGIVAGAVAIAAAITRADGSPVGGLVVTGPSERIDAERWPAIGEMVRDAAGVLSRQ